MALLVFGVLGCLAAGLVIGAVAAVVKPAGDAAQRRRAARRAARR